MISSCHVNVKMMILRLKAAYSHNLDQPMWGTQDKDIHKSYDGAKK